MGHLDLRSLRLRAGDELDDARELDIAPFALGGQRYVAVPETVASALTVTRTTDGWLFRLRFSVRLHGPCMRCLDDAVLDREIDVREYQAESSAVDEELVSPYVVDQRLDLAGWGHDSVALALPDRILCRPDCAGLCPECGRNLNREPHVHEPVQGDPRWAALAELRDSL